MSEEQRWTPQVGDRVRVDSNEYYNQVVFKAFERCGFVGTVGDIQGDAPRFVRVDVQGGYEWFRVDDMMPSLSPDDADLRAVIEQLKAQLARYTDFLHEIQNTRVLSSSVQGWQACTDLATRR